MCREYLKSLFEELPLSDSLIQKLRETGFYTLFGVLAYHTKEDLIRQGFTYRDIAELEIFLREKRFPFSIRKKLK